MAVKALKFVLALYNKQSIYYSTVFYVLVIRAIVFDLWGTLVHKGFSVNGELLRHFKIRSYHGYLNDYESSLQLRRWRSMDGMSREFLKSFGLSINQKNVRYVTSLFRKGINQACLYEGILEILSSLRRGYCLGLLSNTSVFESRVVSRLSLRPFFRATVFSWEIGVLKPSKEAFVEIASRLSVKPKECLFIDDTKENVLGARRAGMKAIRFTSVKNLSKQLNRVIP